MAKRYYWLKLKEDYLDSPKIKKLRKIAGGDTFTIIYLKMQLLSVKNQGVILYEGIEPTIAEELALKLNEDVDNVKVTLSYLSSQGLFEGGDESSFLLPEALSSIGSENESAQRVREFRKKKALQCNAAVTECNTDIDIEKDIDIEIDREKEREKKTGDKPPARKFIKPTVEQVKAYCRERSNGIDAERFVDYYESNGWRVGKTPMKDWQAAVRTWERRDKDERGTGKGVNQDKDCAGTVDLSHVGTVV